MDRRAACMTYQGDRYTDASPWEYFSRSNESRLMNPRTRREMGFLLEMLRDRGEEETFRYIRENVLTGKPFPWEEKGDSDK